MSDEINIRELEYHPGKILLASPALRDPNFSRSVIYLTEHSDEGAHGIIINMPLATKAGDLLPNHDFSGLCDIPAYCGGPVSKNKLTFARIGWDKKKGRFVFDSHLTLEEARDGHLAGEDIRAFVGYSGWTEGQLEAELIENAWFPHFPTAEVAETGNLPHLWTHLMQEKGPVFDLMSRMPVRPELN